MKNKAQYAIKTFFEKFTIFWLFLIFEEEIATIRATKTTTPRSTSNKEIFKWYHLFFDFYCQSIYPSIYVTTYLSIGLCNNLFIYISIYLSIDLCNNLFIYISIYLSIGLCNNLFIYISMYLSIDLCNIISNYISIYQANDRSI